MDCFRARTPKLLSMVVRGWVASPEAEGFTERDGLGVLSPILLRDRPLSSYIINPDKLGNSLENHMLSI